jgi:hypothetical protein
MKTLDERKAGTTCTRCGQSRRPFKDWTDPYTCGRCSAILAKRKNVLDPKAPEVTPEVQAARSAKGRAAWALQTTRRKVSTDSPDGQGEAIEGQDGE